MYTPEPFSEDHVDILHEAIRRAGLATLVSLTGTVNLSGRVSQI